MNSSSFSRAEARWLEPTDYRPTPDDIDYDLQKMRREVKTITLTFADEYCGEVEDSSDVDSIVSAAKTMISTLDEKATRMEELEEVLSSFPDPDAEYDSRDFLGDGE